MFGQNPLEVASEYSVEDVGHVEGQVHDAAAVGPGRENQCASSCLKPPKVQPSFSELFFQVYSGRKKDTVCAPGV